MRLTLRTHLLLGFGLTLSLSFAAAVVSIAHLRGTVIKFKDEVSSILVIADDLESLRSDFQLQVQEWKNTLLRGDEPAGIDKHWSAFRRQEAVVQERARKVNAALPDPFITEQLNLFIAEHARLGEAYARAHGAYVSGGHDFRAADTAVRGIDHEPARILAELVKHIGKETDTRTTADARLAEASARRALWVLGAVTILGIGVALLIARSINRPVQSCVAAMNRLARGDLTARVGIERSDELGDLARSIDSCAAGLRELVGSLITSSETLVTSARSLKDSAHGQAAAAEQTTTQAHTVATAGEELSANAKAMADSATQITRSTTTVAASMEEMSSSIQEVARNCAQESEIARKADQQARQTREQMARLDESARQIGQVVDLINRIAEQTNLLALNAAIEAASAGEAGRGFAVVANEVKELARQSASATDDIRKQVALIQDNAGSSMRSLDEVAKVIEQVAHIASSIAAAVEQQSATTSEIVGTIHQVSASTSSLSQNVAQTSDGAAEVARNISGVSQAAAITAKSAASASTSAAELDSLSTRLRDLVARFKTE